MSFEVIKNYWPLLAALAAGTAAWGQQQEKINTLEKTVVRLHAQDEKIQAVKEQGLVNEVQIRQVQSDVRNLQLEVREQNKYLRALVEANPKAQRNLKD
jgi:hypothetical protein